MYDYILLLSVLGIHGYKSELLIKRNGPIILVQHGYPFLHQVNESQKNVVSYEDESYAMDHRDTLYDR